MGRRFWIGVVALVAAAVLLVGCQAGVTTTSESGGDAPAPTVEATSASQPTTVATAVATAEPTATVAAAPDVTPAPTPIPRRVLEPGYVPELSDRGVGDVEFDAPIEDAIALISGYLGSDPEYTPNGFYGESWEWSGEDLLVVAGVDDTFGGWLAFTTEPPLPIDGLTGITGDLTFATEPPGRRSSSPGKLRTSSLPILTWVDSGLIINWKYDWDEFLDSYPPDVAAVRPELYSISSYGSLRAESARDVVVQGDGVNLRNAPSLNAAVLDQASAGDRYEATTATSTDDDGREWTFVVPHDPTRWTGWMATEFLSP